MSGTTINIGGSTNTSNLILASSGGSISDNVVPTPEIKSFKIGLLYPEQGPIESIAPEMLKAAQEAIREVNILPNFNFTLEAKNSQCVPSDVAPVSARELINNGAQILVGAACSGATSATLAEVAVPNKIPMISYAATSPSLSEISGGEYFSRSCGSDSEASKLLSNYIYNVRNINKIIITNVNSDYGQGYASYMKSEFELLGGTVLGTIEHNDASVNDATYITTITNQMNALATSDCALCIFGYVDTGGIIIQEKFNTINNSNIKLYAYGDGMISTSSQFITPVPVNSIGASPIASSGSSYLNTSVSIDWDATFVMQVYDAMALAILSLVMGGNESRLIENLGLITNEPGVTIYPGQLTTGIQKILEGKSINYSGASFNKLSKTPTNSYENKNSYGLVTVNSGKTAWVSV
tara:strand:- start:246 stop:1478 length:1233 start_codon:yes stop_codon:yes gene_type:complete